MILAGGDIGIRVLLELCNIILDGKGMLEDWATSVVIPILEGKGMQDDWTTSVCDSYFYRKMRTWDGNC